ncbi:MAG: ABC transporter ATP-binding protein [Clostridiaceae bacterium]|nr:ABC transporter ATP-binding protein [Clostridiaceae bacterium]
MSNDNIIKVENFKQQFGKFVVLENINLEVKRGEIIGLLGPSGSGKTTLVKAIVGMSEPTEGTVSVLQTKMPSLSVVSRIGYMAQSDALYEDLNAYDNILFFSSLYGMKGKEAKKRADEVLELVLLREHGKKLVRNFSGGMKRRLSLAIALVHNPEILILDEPTVGIDPVLRVEFWKEFERVRAAGVTIIITTHVMDEAEHCDRLALIRDGGIIAIGTPEELKKNSGESTVEGAFLYYGKKVEVKG